MIYKIFPAFVAVVLLASCSTTRKGSASVYGSGTPATQQTAKGSTARQLRFLDEIAVEPAGSTTTSKGSGRRETAPPDSRAGQSDISLYMNRGTNVEKASSLQFKYAVLLNTEVEQLDDLRLIGQVDEWYGTRYLMGGTTKSGIDCSAFVQSVCLGAYAFSLPRTAREQYRVCRKISSTELREGDLVFFNTTGGISHVGIYLRNNKFAHSSSSQGVTVSDMFDPYYLKHFAGAGRFMNNETGVAGSR